MFKIRGNSVSEKQVARVGEVAISAADASAIAPQNAEEIVGTLSNEHLAGTIQGLRRTAEHLRMQPSLTSHIDFACVTSAGETLEQILIAQGGSDLLDALNHPDPNPPGVRSIPLR